MLQFCVLLFLFVLIEFVRTSQLLTPSTSNDCLAELNNTKCESMLYCKWGKSGCSIAVTCETVGNRKEICESIKECNYSEKTCTDKCQPPNCDAIQSCVIDLNSGGCSSPNSYKNKTDKFCISSNSTLNSTSNTCDCHTDIIEGLQCETCISNKLNNNGHCRSCSNQIDCNNFADNIISGSLYKPGCQCECKANYKGETCNLCDGTYEDYPTCSPCPVSKGGYNCSSCDSGYFNATLNILNPSECSICNDTYCNGGSAVEHNDKCVCNCELPNTGTHCLDCVPPAIRRQPENPCELCDISTCNEGASRTETDSTRTSCVCVCLQSRQGEFCENCAPSYAGYPSCEPCSASICHGNAYGIDIKQSQLYNKCICKCIGSYNATENCALCPEMYKGVLCNECALGYYGQYPSCQKCDFSKCQNSASMTTNKNGECECVCEYKWEGQYCDSCDRSRFDASCRKCIDPHASFPICASQCDTSIHCSGDNRTVSVHYDRLMNDCYCVCSPPWGGKCNTCAEPYHAPIGDLCTECSENFYLILPLTYPPKCQRCSIAYDCNGANNAYDAFIEDNVCQCKCRNGWEGERCQTCPFPKTGYSCGECLPGYFGYPDCDIKCPSCGEFATRGQRECECVCLGHSIDSKCGICPLGKAAPFCVTCELGLIKYPECRPCLYELDCDTSRTVKSITPISSISSLQMCYCEYDDQDDYCKPPRYDKDCNICSLAEHCNNFALHVEAVDGECSCTCRRTPLPTLSCKSERVSPEVGLVCAYIDEGCDSSEGYCRCMCKSNNTCGACNDEGTICTTCNGWYQRQITDSLICEPCNIDSGCSKPITYTLGSRYNQATPSFLSLMLLLSSFSIQYSATSRLQSVAGICQFGILEHDLEPLFVGFPGLSPFSSIVVASLIIIFLPLTIRILVRKRKISKFFCTKQPFLCLVLLFYTSLSTSCFRILFSIIAGKEYTAFDIVVLSVGFLLLLSVPLCAFSGVSDEITYYVNPFEKVKLKLYIFFFGEGEWLQSNSGDILSQRGVLLECYAPKKTKFMIVDCLFRLGSAAVQCLNGSSSEDCKNIATVLAIFLVTHMLLISYFQPWACKFDVTFDIIISCVQIGIAWVLSYGFHYRDIWYLSTTTFDYFELANTLFVITSVLQLLKSLFDLASLCFVYLYRRKQLYSDYEKLRTECLLSEGDNDDYFCADSPDSGDEDSSDSSDISVRSVSCIPREELLASQYPTLLSANNPLSIGHDLFNHQEKL